MEQPDLPSTFLLYLNSVKSSLMDLSVPRRIYVQLDDPSCSVAESRLGERT